MFPDDFLPSGAACAGGTGQAENQGFVGNAGYGARLDGGHADFFVGNGAEHFAEAVDFAFKQQFHRVGGDVAREHARAARNQDDLDFGIGNGDGNARTDVVQFVTHQIARMDDVFAVLHCLRQIIAAAVFFRAAGVGNGQDVDIERAECGRWFFERIVFGHG